MLKFFNLYSVGGSTFCLSIAAAKILSIEDIFSVVIAVIAQGASDTCGPVKNVPLTDV